MITTPTVKKIAAIAISIAFFLIQSPHARAINLNPIHHIEKATNWVAEKSGLKPLGDNANEAARRGAAAAEQATVTAQAAEVAVKEMTPKVNVALESITRTSDAAGTILQWVKWPLVVSFYCLALWLASLALKGLRHLSQDAQPLTVPESPVSTPVTTGGRVILIALGASAFFAVFYMFYLDGTAISREQGGTPAYLIIGSVFSILLGLVLFWFPVRRTWSCLMTGFIIPLILFVSMPYWVPQWAA